MAEKHIREARAEIIRATHTDNGGNLSTVLLADALQLSVRQVTLYLQNDFGFNPDYASPRLRKRLTQTAIVFLLGHNLDIEAIANIYGTTTRVIHNILQRTGEPELCQATK